MNFIKMHNVGNDFIIIEVDNLLNYSNIDIKKICHRTTGVGCDQLLVSQIIEHSIYINIFNQDGTIADMCCNGIISVAKLYFDRYEQHSNVTVYICPNKKALCVTKNNDGYITLKIEGYAFHNDYVVIGNTHKITYLDCQTRDSNKVFDIMNTKYSNIPHSDYNINYIYILNNVLFIITIERGVGETLSCGSGAVASVAFAIKNNLINDTKIKIQSKGINDIHSALFVQRSCNGFNLSGRAEYICTGKLL